MASQWPPRRAETYLATIPVYNGLFTVTGIAGALTATISKDGGTFAACSNAVSEVATASGVYKITLTATEMTCDHFILKLTHATYGDFFAIGDTVQTIDLDTVPFPGDGWAEAT